MKTKVYYTDRFPQWMFEKILEHRCMAGKVCELYPASAPSVCELYKWKQKYPELDAAIYAAYQELDRLISDDIMAVGDGTWIKEHEYAFKDKGVLKMQARLRLDSLKELRKTVQAQLTRKEKMDALKTDQTDKVVVADFFSALEAKKDEDHPN